jgi:hypothetical protein
LGSWRKLHNEQQHNLHSSPDTTEAPINDEMGGACNTNEKYKIIVGEREGKRPLGRHRCRWANNVKMHVKHKGHEDVDWTDLPQKMIHSGLL